MRASMRLLKAGAELYRAGVPIAAILTELKALRRDLDRLTTRFVGMVVEHVFAPRLASVPGGAEAQVDAVVAVEIRGLRGHRQGGHELRK